MVVYEIADYIKEAPEKTYTLIVGTDSKGYRGETDFVTAIVIHRKGMGGRYFWRRANGEKIYSLRDKIYKETLLSLDTAQDLVPKIKTALNPEYYKYDLEIHVDIGEVGATRDTIKEVVGMVRSTGFNCKTKPYSYGASVVADKHT